MLKHKQQSTFDLWTVHEANAYDETRYEEIAYAEYRHVVYDVRDKYKQQSTFGANNQHLAFGPYKRRTRTRI